VDTAAVRRCAGSGQELLFERVPLLGSRTFCAVEAEAFAFEEFARVFVAAVVGPDEACGDGPTGGQRSVAVGATGTPGDVAADRHRSGSDLIGEVPVGGPGSGRYLVE
jgi:hypothetical protein